MSSLHRANVVIAGVARDDASYMLYANKTVAPNFDIGWDFFDIMVRDHINQEPILVEFSLRKTKIYIGKGTQILIQYSILPCSKCILVNFSNNNITDYCFKKNIKHFYFGRYNKISSL